MYYSLYKNGDGYIGELYVVASYMCFCSFQASHVLAALQAGSRGTQACINAASTVSGIIGDLDTTIMFATAGTLNNEKEGENFSDHRENILKTAKVSASYQQHKNLFSKHSLDCVREVGIVFEDYCLIVSVLFH